MKANTQTAYLATAPKKCAACKFIERAPATTAPEIPSETIAAITNTKAATITFGKNPSTSSFKKSVTSFKPTRFNDGSKKTTTTNHFATCPIKYPVSRVIPALLKKSSAPIDLKRLSILRALKTCSIARATTLPKSQPTTKKTTAKTSLGVN